MMSVATSDFAQRGSSTGMIQCMNCMVICLQAEQETHSSWCPGYMCTGTASRRSREHHGRGEGYKLSRMASWPASVEHPHNKASWSMVTNVSFILTGLSEKVTFMTRTLELFSSRKKSNLTLSSSSTVSHPFSNSPGVAEDNIEFIQRKIAVASTCTKQY